MTPPPATSPRLSPSATRLRLSRHQRHLLFNTVVLLAAVRLGMRLLPFQRLRRVLTKVSRRPGTPPAVPAPNSEAQVVWAITAAGRLLPGTSTCLARALTALVLLERRGDRADLRIGVARVDAGPLEAHAWLEKNGSVILGELPDLARFLPMPALDNKN
jgi:hypothetical protein